jgi:hypothetical protein
MVVTVLFIVIGLAGTVFFISLAMALGGAGSQAAVIWPVLGGIVCFALFFTGMSRLGRIFRRGEDGRRR